MHLIGGWHPGALQPALRPTNSFPLPILLVQHLPATRPGRLPEVLEWRTSLKVKWAEHGEVMKPGTIYIAPPDRHLIVKPDHWIALSSADRVGWWRPAVDVLFKSAAEVYGTGAIAFDLGGADAMMSPQKIALALQVPAERTI